MLKIFEPSDKVFFTENKALLIVLFIWIFRITVLRQANGESIALNKFVILQLLCEAVMAFHLIRVRFQWKVLFSHPGAKYFCLLYAFALLSTLWSVMPAVSFCFAAENFIILGVFTFMGLQTRSFSQLERLYLSFNFALLLLFFLRNLSFGFFHDVTFSMIAGVMLCYCCGEYNSKNRTTFELKWLKVGILLGLFFLFLCSSSGSIVSAACGIIALMFFAQNKVLRLLAFLMIFVSLTIYKFGDIEIITSIIFPGKSMASIASGHGRQLIWTLILEKAGERPWLGWGHGTVERIIPWYCTDAHNSIIAALGSLGYIGCCLLVLAYIGYFCFVASNRKQQGIRGVFLGIICAFVNSNTSNFVISRGSIPQMAFLALVSLGISYWTKHTHNYNPLPPALQKKVNSRSVN